MTAPRTPRTTEQATALLDRIARIDAELVTIASTRDAAIAATNAVADTLATPLLEDRVAIVAKIEPWWKGASGALLPAKRKSMELGGCMIGSRFGRETLDTGAAGDDAALAKLQAQRWAKPYVRTTVSIDKTATLKALDGPHAKKLGELGFTVKPAAETFFVAAVTQAGTAQP